MKTQLRLVILPSQVMVVNSQTGLTRRYSDICVYLSRSENTLLLSKLLMDSGLSMESTLEMIDLSSFGVFERELMMSCLRQYQLSSNKVEENDLYERFTRL